MRIKDIKRAMRDDIDGLVRELAKAITGKDIYKEVNKGEKSSIRSSI